MAAKGEEEAVQAGRWRKVAVGARERRVMDAMPEERAWRTEPGNWQKARSISSHAQSDLQSKHALRLPNRKEENGRQGNTRSSLYESTTT